MRLRSLAINLTLEAGLMVLGIGMIAVAVPSNDRIWVTLGCSLLAASGCNHLWLVLSQRETYFSLCDLQAASLFISYFGGAAVTLALSEGGLLGNWLGPQNDNLLSAAMYIALFCGVLIALGRIEVRLWRRVWGYLAQPANWPIWAPAVLALIGLAQAVQILDGQISFQGVRTIDGSRLPYGSALVVALAWPVAGLCGWVLGRAELRRRFFLSLTCLSLIPIQLLFSFSYGRRVLLFQCLIFATCFVWARRKGFSGAYLAAIGVAFLPLIYGLWIVFLGLRMENNMYYQVTTERRDIFQRLENTMDLMQSNWSAVARYQETEVTDRVFVIGYLADLLGASKPTNVFGGNALAWEVVNGIPRMLLPSKTVIARGLRADEESIAMRYGFSSSDKPDSLLTTSFVDVHWLGVLYAPFVFLTGAFCALLIRISRSQFLAIYVLAYCYLQGITPEQYFFTQSMNMVRLLVVLTLAMFAYHFVLRSGTAAAAPYAARARRLRP